MESLCGLMDRAYDADEIRSYSRQLGHLPLIDNNLRRDARKQSEL